MDKLEHLVLLNRLFCEDRPTIASNNADVGRVLLLLLNEVQEALADKDDPILLARELADIGFFLLTAFDIIGSDMFEEMREKGARNILKRPAHLYKVEKSYEEIDLYVRQNWTKEDEREFYTD